jgi:preprotein translocase subunit SecG
VKNYSAFAIAAALHKIMVIFEITIFSIISIIFVVMIIRNSKKWAFALQKIYIKEGERLFGDSSSWKDAWVRVLLQIIIIFFAIVLVMMAFSACFGTVHIERNATGQLEWKL